MRHGSNVYFAVDTSHSIFTGNLVQASMIQINEIRHKSFAEKISF